jgi:hypothetical protein
MERLEHLREQKNKIEAQIAKLDARRRTEERRRDTRRKILAGALLLDAVHRDRESATPSGIARWWEARVARLTRPQDRALFGLDDGTPQPQSGAERGEAERSGSPTGA